MEGPSRRCFFSQVRVLSDRRRTDGEIRQEGTGHRRERDAAAEAGDAQERVGPQGHEPQAGDCHRVVGGAREGRKGAAKASRRCAQARGRREEEGRKEALNYAAMTRSALGLFLICATASSLLAQQTPVPATVGAVAIRGRVSAVENDGALPRARLTVNTSDRRAAPVFTDDQGRFVLAVPPPVAATTFTISATKAGFAGVTLTVSSADVSSGRELAVRLARGAAIAGRVIDPAGDPMVYALVLARPVPPAAGTPTIQLLAETDDRGEYRLGGLPAGRYTVAVMGAPTPQREPLGALALRLALNAGGPLPWAEASAASTVELHAGGESTGVDLTLTTAPPPPAVPPTPTTLLAGQVGTSVISGRVLTTGGRPLNAAVVRATRTGMVGRAVVTDKEGRFAIRDLPAGSFTLAASKTG